MLYRHAQAALRLVERIKTDVQHVSDSPSGEVSVGMPTSVANILAAPLVAAVRSTLPDVRLQITESLSGHLAEQVATGRLEMALLFERCDAQDRALPSRKHPSHLDVQPLLAEELFLLTAGNGPFGAPVTLAEAAARPLILPGRINVTRQIVDEAFAQAGLQINVVAELDSLATIKSVVASGHDATILSAATLAGSSSVSGVVACRIAGGALSRLVSLYTYDIGALTSAAQRVSDLILQVSMALVSDGTWIGARALHAPEEAAAD